MRRISAHYVITGEGDILKRGVVTLTDEGVISGIETPNDTGSEKASTEFYNGIIIPGFVNCHCHLELSHMKATISKGTGLGGFIEAINSTRQADESDIISAASKADREMYDEGIVACGDISNKSISFKVKAESKIKYVTFIELFGVVYGKSRKRLDEALSVSAAAEAEGLSYHITPHAVYSVSQDLFSAIIEQAGPAPLFSMHFLESPDERTLASLRSGPMLDSYTAMGISPDTMGMPRNHLETALALAKQSTRLILIHNTSISNTEVNTLVSQSNVSFCLCPGSNRYITGTFPPAKMIFDAGGDIVLGTDSLASNDRLSILNELYLLQESNPGIALEKMTEWATINGAKALGLENELGSLETGKKPGLLLIEDTDLQNMKLLPCSRVRRLL